ncbi:hypothetical protein ABBQ32_010191 [Trebouxia sp. C0010 RCD-2024]
MVGHHTAHFCAPASQIGDCNCRSLHSIFTQSDQKEFELERSALAALLLTEREDTRVLTREYHFKAETLRVFWCKHWQTAQERKQYKLQCKELQDAQGKLTLRLADQCKADKEAQEKALQRQQQLAEQLQVLQNHNSTLAQQLASLEGDKLAMNKVLYELKENVRLQEDQSRSVATQTSAVKSEVSPPQLSKVGAQFLTRLSRACPQTPPGFVSRAKLL